MNGSAHGEKHLLRALRAMQKATVEFEKARRTRDELDVAQAGEKAWLAVSEASKALLRLRGVSEHKLPEGHRGELMLVQRHGGADMAKTYALVHGVLHSNTFYRGMVVWDLTGETIGRAREFVERVQRLAARRI